MTSPDPNAQSGTETGQGTGVGEGQGTGVETGQETRAQSGDQGTGQSQSEPTVSRAEFEQLRNQLRAADQKRAEAEKQYKDLVEKDLPAQEKLQKEAAEATARAEKAEADLKQTRLELAFLKSSKHKWKNPATALKLADLSNVEVEEDGTVRNLDGALDALAKSDPYLLDTDTEDKDNGPKGSTGAPGTGGRQGSATGGAASLASRVPALRTRGIGSSK